MPDLKGIWKNSTNTVFTDRLIYSNYNLSKLKKHQTRTGGQDRWIFRDTNSGCRNDDLYRSFHTLIL